jgi:hypothetical protein
MRLSTLWRHVNPSAHIAQSPSTERRSIFFQNDSRLTRGPRAGRWSCRGRRSWTARGLGRFWPGHKTVVSHSRPIAWERRPLGVAGELGAREAGELARAAVPGGSGRREAGAGVEGAGHSLLERPGGGHGGERG